MRDPLSAAFRVLIPPSVIHRQPLLLFVVAATVGITIDSIAKPSATVWIVLAGILMLAFGIIFWSASSRITTTILTLLMILSLGGYWHNIRSRTYESASIFQVVTNDPMPTIFDGVVDRPPVLRRHPLSDQNWRSDQSPWQTELEVDVRKIRVGTQWQSAGGRVLVTTSGECDHLAPGDTIRVYGQMEGFASPGNPGEQDFRDIYRRRGIHARVHVDTVEQIESLPGSGPQWRPSRIVAALAKSGRERLIRFTGPDTGPLAVALVIGQREFVTPDQRDQLLVTGTVHLLSVSGLHLAIIVVLAQWTAGFLRFPERTKLCWIVIICLLYTALTGGRPPVVRAAVLVTTFVVAISVKRPSQPMNTLALAALIILAWNPTLLFGIGVQLSFLAVATLLLCHGRVNQTAADDEVVQQEQQLEALVEESRSPAVYYARYTIFAIRRALWYSLCVTAISMPLVWYQFHVVSPISVAANVVLGPLLFLALATGVATAVFGFVSPLGILFGGLCDFALTMMRWFIDFAAAVPLGHLWLPSPPGWWIVTFYVVIVATLYLPGSILMSRLRYGWISIWVVIAYGIAATPAALDPGAIEATFVDVGHGTSVVIRSDDRVWLYDCGRLGNDRGRSRDIDSVLWSLGLTDLDGVFLSHADSDHFNALPGVLERFSVAEILTPPDMLSDPEPAVAKVAAIIDQYQIPIRSLATGDLQPLGKHQAQILHPPAERVAGTDNANSLVLRIDAGGRTLLLPGDLEPPGTAVVINRQRPPPGGVLMAPHHGSLRMDAEAVLQWGRPSETIVSGGRRAKRPEVTEMLRANGSGVHVTSLTGAIRVVIDRQGGIEIRSWRENPW